MRKKLRSIKVVKHSRMVCLQKVKCAENHVINQIMVRPREAHALVHGSGVKLPDNKTDSSRMMHCLLRGSWAGETARSSRAIGVCCAVTVFVLLTTDVLEGARVAGKRRWAKMPRAGCNTWVRCDLTCPSRPWLRLKWSPPRLR